MSFRWLVIYYKTDRYGFPASRNPSKGLIRARTKAEAMRKAKDRYGPNVISVE